MITFPRLRVRTRILYRQLKKKANTLLIFLHLKKLFIWVGKRQKLAAWGTSVIMVYNLNVIRFKHNAIVEENIRIKEMLLSKSSTMNDFDFPWYKKIKVGNDFRIIGANKAYEFYYAKDRFKLLGASNVEIAPGVVGMGWRESDSISVARWRVLDTLELSNINDSIAIPVYSHKWPSTDGRDTLVSGVSIPVSRFVAVLNKNGDIEFITIETDTTINKLNN